jgi:hypothetical protein
VSVPLIDSRGCLTAAGVAALAKAPPGQGPPELAAHLVACVRCQDRLLAQSAGLAAGTVRTPSRRPPLARTLLIAAGFVALIAILFLTLTRLAGG